MYKIFYVTISLLMLIALSGCGAAGKKEPISIPHEPTSVSSDSEDYGLNVESYPMKIGNNSTPTEVFLFYFTALQEGNVTEAKTCLSKENQKLKSDDSINSLSKEVRETMSNFQVLYEKTNGNFTKVEYLYTDLTNGGTVEKTLYMIRENNIWKITEEPLSPDLFKNTKVEPGTK